MFDDTVHCDLRAIASSVYEPLGFVCSRPQLDADNVEYGGCSFTVNNRVVVSRVAKLTPTKNGLFVTLWRRAFDGSTKPYRTEDSFDLVVISVREGSHVGQFVFPLRALAEHDVVSVGGTGGKRGFRVYPPWVSVTSRQAARTQGWQTSYFLSVDDGAVVDLARARILYDA